MRLDVYPTIWNRPREEDDTLGYLLEHYDPLREFVAGAAVQGEGLVVCLT